MTKKARKDKKPAPVAKINRQIPNSLIRQVTHIGPGEVLLNAREHPLLGCWIMGGWEESGITPVVVAREQEPGKVMFSSYMVDLYCLGVKDAFTRTHCSRSKFERDLPVLCSGSPEECSVELAHEVIYGALEFAEKYGFQPHPDFKAQKADLMLDPPDTHPRLGQVTFGKDGKPFYIAGPHDDQRKIRSITNTLRRTAGEGNFNFLVGLGDIPEFLDDGV
jgi:hypothetical protein